MLSTTTLSNPINYRPCRPKMAAETAGHRCEDKRVMSARKGRHLGYWWAADDTEAGEQLLYSKPVCTRTLVVCMRLDNVLDFALDTMSR